MLIHFQHSTVIFLFKIFFAHYHLLTGAYKYRKKCLFNNVSSIRNGSNDKLVIFYKFKYGPTHMGEVGG